MKIIVQGAGIAGLTFATAAARNGLQVTVLEQRNSELMTNNKKDSLGGGIGLWPPSQAALEYIGVLDKLHPSQSEWMPAAGYFNGTTVACLAAPSADFGRRFPVLCLQRDALMTSLRQAALDNNVVLREGVTVADYHSSSASVDRSVGGELMLRIKHSKTGTSTISTAAEQSNEEEMILPADILVGADGIHSSTSGVAKLMAKNDYFGAAAVPSMSLGYSYFRACVDISDAAATSYFGASFEAWSRGVRFGYVPLKPPTVFWFCAVPDHMLQSSNSSSNNNGKKELGNAARPITEEEHHEMLRILHSSFGNSKRSGGSSSDMIPHNTGVSMNRLLRDTPHTAILRTPISKLPVSPIVPWTSQDGRIVLIGDAVHATAPNLAQGAGLAIEDAVELALRLTRLSHMFSGRIATNDNSNLVFARAVRQSIATDFVPLRRRRALTVQTLADLVATVGQTESPFASAARDAFMSFGTNNMPRLASSIFDRVVAFSLGGFASATPYCLPSLPYPNAGAATRERMCMVSRALGSNTSDASPSLRNFSRLADHVRKFRSDPNGGCGVGNVKTVLAPSFVAGRLRFALGLPTSNESVVPFAASVSHHTSSTMQDPVQCWTRCFGSGATAFYVTTSQSLALNWKSSSNSSSNKAAAARTTTLLEESISPPGTLGNMVRFQLECKADNKESGVVRYRSVRVVLRLPTRWLPAIPVPRFLAPTSSWSETPTATGWFFKGEIQLPPILGSVSLLHYSGDFRIAESRRSGDEENNSSKKSTAATSQTGAATTDSKQLAQRHRIVVFVTGATGLLGRYLVQSLLAAAANNNNKGQQQQQMISKVYALTRDAVNLDVERFITPSMSCRPVDVAELRERLQLVQWDGKTGEGWCDFIANELKNNDSKDNGTTITHIKIVNLAGESLQGAWTEDKRESVVLSRANAIAACADAIKRALKLVGGSNNNNSSNIEFEKRITLLQASGTGIYGDGGDSELSEGTAATTSIPETATADNLLKKSRLVGRTFRRECVEVIENTAVLLVQRNISRDIAVIQLRIGFILSASGGILPHIDLAARLGASRFGTGKQFVPIVHIVDAAERITNLCLKRSTTTAASSRHSSSSVRAVNIVAPQLPRNAEMLKTVSKARHFALPNFVPLPEWLLASSNLIVGDATCVLVDSCRALDSSAKEDGFEYKRKDLASCLATWECNVDSSKM